jgi:hypothetical protein
VTVAPRIVLTWARLYTSGMPDVRRRARLDEVASDLWEHVEHGTTAGRRRLPVQLEIAGRAVRGAGSDLGWRFAHRSVPLRLATVCFAGWAVFALGIALLLFFTGTSGAPVLGIYSVEDSGAAREFARVAAIVFVALVAGLALVRRRPHAAVGLVAAGSIGILLYVLCLWPILGPAAAASIAGTATIRPQARARREGAVGLTGRSRWACRSGPDRGIICA